MDKLLFNPFPKYIQIRDIIERWLNTLQPGDKLPTEHELARNFRVSRETIRQALKRLSVEGIIQRRPRLGTVLVRHPAGLPDHRLTGPIEEFSAHGIATTVKVLQFSQVKATSEVASLLQTQEGGNVYLLSRLRHLHDEPVVVLDAYFPEAVGDNLKGHDVRKLIVPILKKICGDDIHENYQIIDAIIADSKLAGYLDIFEGSPVLLVKRLFFDGRGNPVVLFNASIRADRYYYTVHIRQPRSFEAGAD